MRGRRVRGARLGRLRPIAHQNQPVLGSGHGDVESTNALGGGDPSPSFLDAVEVGRRGAKETVFEAIRGSPTLVDVHHRQCAVSCLGMQLHKIDVSELEPLGLVDRQHLHGVHRSLPWPRLFGLLSLGDTATQRPQDGGHVATAVLESLLQAPEESIQIGEPVGAEITGRLGCLEEPELSQLFDEEIRGLVGVRRSEQRQVLDRS